MSKLIEVSTNTYNHVFHELVDHRTDNWFLMDTPWTSVVIVAFYLYFVKVAPRYMKDKPAYNLDKIICVYNLFQIASSAYIVIRAFRYGWGGKYSLICEPTLKTMWYYYLLKIIDLLDTVFFILRKKQNQVTFLHVFHHSGMVLVGWIWTKFIPGIYNIFKISHTLT
ncbi:Elongation of very long chain fatty acids protein 7 [Blattella germanica]|nr:Elongation of very long chain fatty acids protein 7 [Blattella germanica]